MIKLIQGLILAALAVFFLSGCASLNSSKTGYSRAYAQQCGAYASLLKVVNQNKTKISKSAWQKLYPVTVQTSHICEKEPSNPAQGVKEVTQAVTTITETLAAQGIHK